MAWSCPPPVRFQPSARRERGELGGRAALDWESRLAETWEDGASRAVPWKLETCVPFAGKRGMRLSPSKRRESGQSAIYSASQEEPCWLVARPGLADLGLEDMPWRNQYWFATPFPRATVVPQQDNDSKEVEDEITIQTQVDPCPLPFSLPLPLLSLSRINGRREKQYSASYDATSTDKASRRGPR